MAHEVDRKAENGLLTAELRIVELSIAQTSPKQRLDVGGLAPQASRSTCLGDGGFTFRIDARIPLSPPGRGSGRGGRGDKVAHARIAKLSRPLTLPLTRVPHSPRAGEGFPGAPGALSLPLVG